GRVLEQRVAVDIDLVEVDVGLAAVQAERRRRGDEVDFVAACGELNAELGGDHTAAAIRGVAGDADLAFWCHQGDWREFGSARLDATGFLAIRRGSRCLRRDPAGLDSRTDK